MRIVTSDRIVMTARHTANGLREITIDRMSVFFPEEVSDLFLMALQSPDGPPMRFVFPDVVVRIDNRAHIISFVSAEGRMCVSYPHIRYDLYTLLTV